MYPDFKNSALISPLPFQVNSSATPETLPAVKIINWTRINERAWTLVAPNYRTTTWEDINIQFKCTGYNNNTWSWSYRVWIPYQLSWWEVVWKEICWWLTSMTIWTFNVSNQQKQLKLTCIVKLLHSDWTLTEVWRLVWDTWRISDNSSSRSKTFTNQDWKFIWVSSSWITAQEWDYIVVDYELYLYANLNFSTNTYTQNFYLWKNASLSDSNRILPLQISID